MRLYTVTVIKIAIPGKSTSHQALNFSLPSLTREPQVTRSGGTPMPRKDKLDSIKMADAIPNAMETKAGAIPFGRACLTMIFNSEKPRDQL